MKLYLLALRHTMLTIPAYAFMAFGPFAFISGVVSIVLTPYSGDVYSTVQAILKDALVWGALCSAAFALCFWVWVAVTEVNKWRKP
jgi:hypothetical protein